MARRRRQDTDDAALIELTPMIDVVFLLLIFFMVSTRIFDPHGYDVELPEAEAAPAADGAAEALIVSVNREGGVAVRGTVYPAGAALPEIESGTEVIIRADRNASHGQVMYWMDKLQLAGVESVTLAAVPTAE